MKPEQKSSSGKAGMGLVFFLAGLVAAQVVGWGVFPNLLYSAKSQPLNFSHASHEDSSCEDCHTFRDDGSYTGIPKLENCRSCHEEPMGESEDERILVEEYIQNDKEIPWLVYTRQPDNVYFSHASHLGEGMECTTCHRDVSKDTKLPVVKTNRLTGYQKDTMKMVECEKCHEKNGTTNACNVCHK